MGLQVEKSGRLWRKVADPRQKSGNSEAKQTAVAAPFQGGD